MQRAPPPGGPRDRVQARGLGEGAMRRPADACKNGHPLTGDNVYVGTQRRWCKALQVMVSYPQRVCRACRRKENVCIRFQHTLPLEFATQ